MLYSKPYYRIIELLFSVVDKVYRVENCTPQILDIDAMLEVLNQTNDLSGFAVTLRRKFSLSC